MTYRASPPVGFVVRMLQYLAILLALIYLSAHLALATPAFIYQGF